MSRAAGRGAKYPVKIYSRVSAEDMDRIREDAACAGVSVCKYVRIRATGGHISGKIDVRTLHELNRIGRMLKKMWSEGHPTGPAISAVIAAAKRLEKNI